MSRYISLLSAAISLLSVCSSGCSGSKATTRSARGAMRAVGEAAPDVEAVDQTGTLHRLADQRGRFVVVFFYPRDATPGCTAEACAFRDVWERYHAAQIQVFGVSSDDQGSKAKFAAAHHLEFPLLADPEHKWIQGFGVPTRLGMAKRVSFLVDPQGRIVKVYADVDPGVHAAQVLADVAAIRAGSPDARTTIP